MRDVPYGELPLALQAKLLHVVEDLRFSRIGGRELITVDMRILAATNRDRGFPWGRILRGSRPGRPGFTRSVALRSRQARRPGSRGGLSQ